MSTRRRLHRAGRRGRVASTSWIALTEKKIEGNPAKAATTPGKERVLRLDAKTGKETWVHEYDCTYQRISYPFGPRTTPTIVGDRVYTLGTMGDLRCLDVNDGKPVWTVNFAKDFKAPGARSGAGRPTRWSTATGSICLVGGEKQAVVAFDRHTGKKLWRRADDGGDRLCTASHLRSRRETAAHHLAFRNR